MERKKEIGEFQEGLDGKAIWGVTRTDGGRV